MFSVGEHFGYLGLIAQVYEFFDTLNVRETEDGELRVTEDGEYRVTE